MFARGSYSRDDSIAMKIPWPMDLDVDSHRYLSVPFWSGCHGKWCLYPRMPMSKRWTACSSLANPWNAKMPQTSLADAETHISMHKITFAGAGPIRSWRRCRIKNELIFNLRGQLKWTEVAPNRKRIHSMFNRICCVKIDISIDRCLRWSYTTEIDYESFLSALIRDIYTWSKLIAGSKYHSDIECNETDSFISTSRRDKCWNEH